MAAGRSGGRAIMNDASSLGNVLAAYCPEPSRWEVAPLGAGNINDTYLVQSRESAFVLQKINCGVFFDPLRVIDNFEKINTYLSLNRPSSKPGVRVASPVRTLAGCSHYVDENGDFWRAQSYIPHSSKCVLKDAGEARQVGVILAAFHSRLEDFDSSALEEPLPGFHDLPLYLQAFDAVSREMSRETGRDLRYCFEIVDKYRDRATTLTRATQAGILRPQPVHGDPKLDNFLFNDRNECFGLLDLDTVSMGLIHHDLGDCLRSCCNRAGEAGGDNLQVIFDLQICRALLDGYFSASRGMGELQRHCIFDGVLLICFELGLRFLTDFLDGNHYFKVEQDDDNLFKAVNQFRLTVDVDQKENSIRNLVEDVASSFS
jgi:hypothetical protein